jgi:hypothetical protein
MGYLQQLKTLIDSEPLNADKTDAEVETWVNELVPTDVDVSWTDLTVWATTHDTINKLEAAKSTGTPDKRKLANGALLLINTGRDLSSSRPDVKALVGAMGAILDPDELTALTALTTAQKPRRGALRAPRHGEVAKARGLL